MSLVCIPPNTSCDHCGCALVWELSDPWGTGSIEDKAEDLLRAPISATNLGLLVLMRFTHWGSAPVTKRGSCCETSCSAALALLPQHCPVSHASSPTPNPQPRYCGCLQRSCSSSTYLQWTTMGPACEGLSVFTFFRNFNIPMGVKGTPKSGQLVKWSCETSRGALQLSGSCCKGEGRGERWSPLTLTIQHCLLKDSLGGSCQVSVHEHRESWNTGVPYQCEYAQFPLLAIPRPESQ